MPTAQLHPGSREELFAAVGVKFEQQAGQSTDIGVAGEVKPIEFSIESLPIARIGEVIGTDTEEFCDHLDHLTLRLRTLARPQLRQVRCRQAHPATLNPLNQLLAGQPTTVRRIDAGEQPVEPHSKTAVIA